MGRISTAHVVCAPLGHVFEIVAHIENFRQAVPEIIGVEYLSEIRRGVGTRFRETRRMGKREAAVELEVTEYTDDDHIRIVSDAGGTIWDTVFRVEPHGDSECTLTMTMEDKPYKFLARIFNPCIRPLVRRAVERDMAAVKAFCERTEQPSR